MGKRFVDLRDSSRFKQTQPCPKCGGHSRVDWVDLVKQQAAHTCRSCGAFWMDFGAHAKAR